MSERPKSSSKAPNRTLDTNPSSASPGKGVAAGAGTDRSFEAADAIWDPEIKTPAIVKDNRALAKMPRQKSPNRLVSVEHEKPGTMLRQISQSPPLSNATFIPPFPQSSEKRSWSGTFWFIICVVVPIAVAWNYYGRVASERYVSEFHFSVQDASPQSTAQSATSATSGVMALIGGGGNSAMNNNYIVVDYLTSRQAVEALQERIKLTNLYSRPDIDWWSRFNASKPMEAFMRYWATVMTAHFDQVTGIATAQVQAFTPGDALLIANTLVTLSEDLVNKILNRTYTDAIRAAQVEVDKAEQRMRTVRARLTEYRNRVGVIDPNTSVVASSASLVQSLRTVLAQQEAQLSTMLRQNLLPTAPAVVVLKHQIQSTKEQLDILARDIGKNAQGGSLSKVMGEYEQLDLERQFSQTMLTATLQALDQARANAALQHLYITPYVRPSLATSSDYWTRYASIIRVAAGAFLFWVIGLLVVRSIRERFN